LAVSKLAWSLLERERGRTRCVQAGGGDTSEKGSEKPCSRDHPCQFTGRTRSLIIRNEQRAKKHEKRPLRERAALPGELLSY